MTRIISGSLRGRQLLGPKKEEVRPTTDRAREALFNILHNEFYWDEIRALDLFSGIGTMALELASRGCTDVTAVDGNPKLVNFVDQMAEKFGVEGLRSVHSDTLTFISKDFQQYDLIIADPPFDFEAYENMIHKIFQHNLLKEDGLLVVEHQERTDLSDIENYERTRKYGNVAFSFFRPS